VPACVSTLCFNFKFIGYIPSCGRASFEPTCGCASSSGSTGTTTRRGMGKARIIPLLSIPHTHPHFMPKASTQKKGSVVVRVHVSAAISVSVQNLEPFYGSEVGLGSID
jgi:hypothetical protein